MPKVALVAMIHPPGSPEDVLRCNAWPGAHLCPRLMFVPRDVLTLIQRARAARQSFRKCLNCKPRGHAARHSCAFCKGSGLIEE